MTDSKQSKKEDAHSDGYRFEFTLRVRWAEADIQGVVFNGHYLTYFDIGITEYLRAAMDGDADLMHDIFDKLYVVKSTVEYKSPARFDQMISIQVRVARIGRTSINFEFAVNRDGQVLVTGENIYVYAPEGDASPIPDSLRNKLASFERSASVPQSV